MLDRARAKPARASNSDSIHPEPPWHCAIVAVGGLRFSLVAAASAFSEHALHAVHHARRPADSGRSPTSLLGTGLHAGKRLVPFSGPCPERANLDRQG